MSNLASYFDPENLKQVFNKVQAAVYNYTEYQAKVMEATNGEPWGASSTLMTEIANATQSPIHFNDIMDTIYKKFQEKGANWRQCYKALQLLEYLIKNGSERVVDSAKDHIYELKALKNFNYVDEKMKDQGLNGMFDLNSLVRNRAKEISDLLADNNKIRDERKKARENRQKYTGVASNSSSMSGMGFGNTGNKYGGFSSESYYSGSYGGSSSGGGGRSGGFRDEDTTSPPKSPAREAYDPSPVASTADTGKIQIVMKGVTPAKKDTAPDLLDMGSGGQDDDWGDFTAAPSSSKAAAASSTKSAAPSSTKNSPLDDFAGFQASLPAVTNNTANPNGFAAFPPPPSSGTSNDLLGFSSQPMGAVRPLASNSLAGMQFSGISTQPAQLNQNLNGMAARPAGFTGGMSSQQPVFTGMGNQQSQGFTGMSSRPGGFQSMGNQQTGGFANFSSPSTAAPVQKPDPFSNLVSLDAKSLLNPNKQAAPTGPSLNNIQKPKTNDFGAFSSGNNNLI